MRAIPYVGWVVAGVAITFALRLAVQALEVSIHLR